MGLLARALRRPGRLRRLRSQAGAAPQDAQAQAAYLRALLDAGDAEGVLRRVDAGGFRSGPEVVVEYLDALVSSERHRKFRGEKRQGGAPVSTSGVPSDLSLLLGRLQYQAGGGMAGVTPVPAGGGSGEAAGRDPVVFLQGVGGAGAGERAAGGSWLGRLFRDFFRALAVVVMLSVVWLFGAVFCRRYYNNAAGGAPAGGGAAAQAGGGTAQFLPKEYNKENMPEESVKNFGDVKGCDEAKEELQEIVEYLKNPSKFTRLGGKLPKGILLTGSPGTGKTLLAKAVAGEAGVPFFYRSGSEFEEMFVGVGARRVRSLFAAAKKKSPCIVFIDEIDAVGGNRKSWGEHHNKKTLNQLLVEMDGFEENTGTIVIAATNLPETLDKALTRPGRFDRTVHVPLPDISGRKQILDLYLKKVPIAEDVETEVIARTTVGFSGADLANLVNTAACQAAKNGLETLNSMTLDMAKDRILMGAERKTMVLTEESREATAYHESGHAVVALRTRGALPIHKATIMPRGSALGMVTQLPERDQSSLSREQLVARLDVCMGGKVAEEHIYGADKTTTGVSEDLRQATRLARYMVTECGMNDAVGPVYVKDYQDNQHSSDLQRVVDEEVTKALKESYARVQVLLKKHEADLHSLSKALMEHETLTQSDIKRVLEGKPLERLVRAPPPPEQAAADPKKLDLDLGNLDVQGS